MVGLQLRISSIELVIKILNNKNAMFMARGKVNKWKKTEVKNLVILSFSECGSLLVIAIIYHLLEHLINCTKP